MKLGLSESAYKDVTAGLGLLGGTCGYGDVYLGSIKMRNSSSAKKLSTPYKRTCTMDFFNQLIK